MNLLSLPNDNSIVESESQLLDIRILDYLSSRNSKQGLSENSKLAYKQVILDFNRFIVRNELEISEQSLKAYFDSISHLSPATKNQRKYALAKVIKAQFGNTTFKAIALDKVFGNILNFKIDSRIDDDEILSESQVKDLMNVAGNKTRVIINFLFQTGCRVSEMTGIRLSDCEIITDKVKIRVTGKGSKIREVFIRYFLYQVICDVYQGKTWLFESKSGKPLNRKNIWKQVQNTGKKIGLTNIYPHMLRHTRATDMIINKNVSMKATSQYLGHSSTAITLDMYVKDRVDIDELFAMDSI